MALTEEQLALGVRLAAIQHGAEGMAEQWQQILFAPA